MENKALCAICGEGHVTAQTREVETEYKGTKALLPMHYQLCDTCTSDYAGMAESKLNKRIVMAFRKQVDGLLTGAEITALRKQYQLTQAQAAKLFGGGPVAFSKYENDDVAQSEAMDTLLRLVRRSPAAFWALVEEKGLQTEIAKPQSPLRSMSKVVSITAVRAEVGSPDPSYNPREFRRRSFSHGAVPCLQ
ncbi:type II toxin-antitoxin system MqsA family antitoxin [Paracidovorax sp. MALMAid1276]|uniref:type II toxin-antitoxin system MqsA family antitoxin n=1 Tax=Paracidovorax sp. MALMAid1276 TaxID=3411631 RepID=UPI003B9B27AA